MENNSFQTSFIPKKPLVSGSQVPVSASRPMGVFNFLSILFVIMVIALYGGLFVYKNLLSKNLNNLHTSLKTSQNSFELETIGDLQLFDKRMAVSKQVMSGHIVFSPLFELISELTLPSVQFTKFGQTSSVDGRNILVNMSGLAKDYRSIALQAQVLNSDKGKYFKDVVFSNLGLADEKDKKGYVKFEISFSVDPTLLSYEKAILKSGEKKTSTTLKTDMSNLNANTASDPTVIDKPKDASLSDVKPNAPLDPTGAKQ